MNYFFIDRLMVFVDDSMVVFYNKYAPGQITYKKKKFPPGDGYHTTKFCETKSFFWVELLQGKEKTRKGDFSEAKFKYDFSSYISALVAIINEPMWGLIRAVIMVSGFKYMPSFVHMKTRLLIGTTVIKKKGHWMNHTKAQKAVDEI